MSERTETAHNADGSVTTTTYDADGNVTSTSTAAGSGSVVGIQAGSVSGTTVIVNGQPR